MVEQAAAAAPGLYPCMSPVSSTHAFPTTSFFSTAVKDTGDKHDRHSGPLCLRGGQTAMALHALMQHAVEIVRERARHGVTCASVIAQ